MTEHKTIPHKALSRSNKKLVATAKGESDFQVIAFAKPECATTLQGKPVDLRSWTDEELIVLAQGGTSSALEELLTRYRSMVYRTVRRFTESAEEAEDLVQETMLRAFVNIAKFRKEARFSSWLIAIAVNTALSEKRKTAHFHWIYLDDPGNKTHSCSSAWPLSDKRPSPEQECIHQELRILLRREVLKQHSKYRFILRACDLSEFSIEKTARALGITREAAKSRLFRARRMLSVSFRRHAIRRVHTRAAQMDPVEALKYE